MAHPCYVCTFYPVPDGEGVECPHCHRLQYGNTCPHCGQNAPTLIKGLGVFCSACGHERGPLGGGLPMNIAGKPSKIGGTVAGIAGAVMVFVGVLLGVVGGGLLAFTWPLVGILGALLHFAGATVGVVGLLSALLGWWAIRGGRKLNDTGTTAGRHAREQAIFAVASHKGGIVTATDVAAALNIQHAEADALLTAMAREGTHVGVEVDGAGGVNYVFREIRAANGGAPVRTDTGVRVDPSAPEQIRAQVDQEYERLRAVQALEKRQG